MSVVCVIKIFVMTVDDVPVAKGTRIARLDANTNVNAAERFERREKKASRLVSRMAFYCGALRW